MYVRSNRYGQMNIPDNYSGNAFREKPAEGVQPSEPLAPVSAEPVKEAEEPEKVPKQSTPEVTAASVFPPLMSPKFGLKLGNLGLGSEEFLIAALILLLSDSEGGAELVLILALLFFVQ